MIKKIALEEKIGLGKYRYLLSELISRDLKVKYRRSVLGYLWSVLNPLLMMIVLTIVFSTMFRFDIPNYPVYILSGQLIFNFFSESTNMAMTSILGGASLIKKVYLPKYIFPLSRTLSSFVTMLFSLVALVIVMLVTGASFHVTIVLFPLVLIYLLVFCVGVGLMLSVAVVYFRDTQYLYSVFLTALNYLTPIFYPASMLPGWLKPLMIFNPLYDYVGMFRNIMIYGQWPTFGEHAICIAFASCFLLIGIEFFKKHQKNFILHI